jgi:DNA end-binding protein Ku
LKDLLKEKQKGEMIEKPKERAPSNMVNLMDALRPSVQAEKQGAKSKAPAGRLAADRSKRAPRARKSG